MDAASRGGKKANNCAKESQAALSEPRQLVQATRLEARAVAEFVEAGGKPDFLFFFSPACLKMSQTTILPPPALSFLAVIKTATGFVGLSKCGGTV